MSDAYQLFEVHEERIQRLEDDRADLGAQVAKQTATLEALSEHMRADMDRLVTNICNMNTTLGAAVQRLDEKATASATRITVLESGEEKSEKWKDLVRKVVLWALTSGVTGLVGWFAHRYLNH